MINLVVVRKSLLRWLLGNEKSDKRMRFSGGNKPLAAPSKSMAAINASDLSQTSSLSIISAADKVTDNQVPWTTIEIDARELANVLRSKDSTGECSVS